MNLNQDKKIYLNFKYFTKIKILFIIIYLIFTNTAIAKISINAQKSLIDSNMIHEDIDCNKLIELIGGERETRLLWLGNLKGGDNQFALLNTPSKDNNKVFYICGNINDLKIDEDAETMDVLRDRNLIKIFYDPIELFTYIFSITSQKSRENIQSRSNVYEEEFNITSEEMMSAFLNGVTQIDTTKIKKKQKRKKSLK